MTTSLSLKEKLFGDMILIRRFEERILELFDEGLLVGTTHCYIGQEANGAGVINNLLPSDIIWSNHRCHGHYLSFTQDANGLMAELMGKKTGTVGGRGGSQHLCHANFFSNGIQGGIVPAAVGMAFAQKHKNQKNIVTVFIGDGTLGEGIVYESLNLASLWKLPILFVVENNHYAQSTPTKVQLAGSISARLEAFGIETLSLATFDAVEIYNAAHTRVEQVRTEQRPHALILDTYRFCHHSKSDDHRDKKEVDEWMKKDPITIMASYLSKESIQLLEQQASQQIATAEALARQAENPTLAEFSANAFQL